MDSNVVHQDSNQKVPFLTKHSSLFSDRHFTLCASNDFAELNIAVYINLLNILCIFLLNIH